MPRPKLRTMDRLLWVGLASIWTGWRQALVIVSPDARAAREPGPVLAEATALPSQDSPTARLRILFVLVVLAHHRRRLVHFNVTEHPTAHWTAQQVIAAFPEDCAPRYLLRDRDRIYGDYFQHRIKGY